MKRSIEVRRQQAWGRPFDGRHKRLAEEVRRLLGWEPGYTPRPNTDWEFLTPREAEKRTGVSFATINGLTRGFRASEDSLRKFAQGLNADESMLLLAGGYLPLEITDGKEGYFPFDTLAEIVRMVRLDRPWLSVPWQPDYVTYDFDTTEA